MTERDEIAFTRVLKEFHPAIMIIEKDYGDDDDPLIPLKSIAHAKSNRVDFAVPAPGDEDRWQINLDMQCLMVHPKCQFYLERSVWGWFGTERKWAFDDPLLSWAEITISFPRDDPGEILKKFATKNLRLFGKVSKQGVVGLDACLWSQSGGDVRRAYGAGFRIDPDENIKLNKYYDDSQWDDGLSADDALKQENR